MRFCLRKSIPFGLLVVAILRLNSAAMGETGQRPVSDRVSEADLRQSLRAYQNMSQLDVDFQQIKTIKEMRQPLRAKGHLTVRPPDSVIYQMTSPAALLVTLTPKKITIESGKGNDKTTQVLDVASLQGSKEHRNLQAMVSWLQMDPHALAQAYKVTRTQPAHFHFEPTLVKDSPFTSLDLTLNAEGSATHLFMHEVSGDQIEFIFAAPKVRTKK